jgi:hypothetical protein
MTGKERERHILTAVYSNQHYAEITETERPDFALQPRHMGLPAVGVEVTEVYQSESHARLSRIPNYLTAITEEGRFRHKRDKTELAPGSFDIIAPDGTKKGTARGIITPVPTTSELLGLLISAIVTKDRRIEQYADQTATIELVVMEHLHLLSRTELDDAYATLFIPPMRQVLFQTGFVEVRLVTRIKDLGWVALPLRMLLLLGSLYLFNGLVQTRFSAEAPTSGPMAAYCEYLRSKGASAYPAVEDGLETVVLGCAGITVRNGSPAVFDYSLGPAPAQVDLQPDEDAAEFVASERFRQADQEYLERMAFSTALYNPLTHDIDFRRDS